jgi:hypothetical protein
MERLFDAMNFAKPNAKAQACAVAHRLQRLVRPCLPEHALILIVRANPHPDKIISVFNCQGSVSETNSN